MGVDGGAATKTVTNFQTALANLAAPAVRRA